MTQLYFSHHRQLHHPVPCSTWKVSHIRYLKKTGGELWNYAHSFDRSRQRRWIPPFPYFQQQVLQNRASKACGHGLLLGFITSTLMKFSKALPFEACILSSMKKRDLGQAYVFHVNLFWPLRKFAPAAGWGFTLWASTLCRAPGIEASSIAGNYARQLQS